MKFVLSLKERVFKQSMHSVYFFVVFFFGILYSIVMPPLSAPDEVAHYITAYELSSKMLFHPSPLYDEEGRMLIRAEDTFIDDWQGDRDNDNATVVGRYLTRELYEEIGERGLFSTGEEGYHYTLQTPLRTSIFAYLLPAIGFSLARILHLGGFGLLYLGRLMNLLLFSFLGSQAVKRAPIGKELIFLISLFPMSLELVSSLSYDCYILALSFYLIATVLDLSLKKTKIEWKDVVTLSLLAVLLSPCKMVYAVLFLACFAIAPSKFQGKKQYLLCIALIGFLMLASVLVANLSSIMQYVFPSENVINSVDWVEESQESTTYQLRELLRSPIVLLKILRNTIMIQGDYYLYTMAGGALGHLEEGLGLSVPLITLLYLLTVSVGVLGREEEPSMSLVARMLFLIVPILIVIALFISMLTAYTPIRTDYALGVQGRYFLPMLPMFLLGFRIRITGKQGRFHNFIEQFPKWAIFVVCIMNLFLLCTLYIRISGRSMF